MDADMDDAARKSFACGHRLAHPDPGDEVCITGTAAKLPESPTIPAFYENLLSGRDLVTCDSRRWQPTNPEVPNHYSKIDGLEEFDAGFFGYHPHFCDETDPITRLLLERAVECVFDAGMNPHELAGSRTGVYLGVTFVEGEKRWYEDKEFEFGISGCIRAMNATYISHALKLQGPSVIMDTACSASMYGLERAYTDIRNGVCDSALIGSALLVLHPGMAKLAAAVGILSLQNECRCFDEGADGYVRAEAVTMFFLQKAKDSRRIYARVVHCKTNCDGFKDTGFLFPSSDAQALLMKEVYTECGLDMNDIGYFEAHCTGTKAGDPGELRAIDKVVCSKRKKPLLLGSVKSNMGHTEPASGCASLTKVICAMEYGLIPPNIHFKRPRESIRAIVEGRAIVVCEPTPFDKEDVYVCLNNLGFGGSNFHMVLRRNLKKKVQMSCGYPVVVCICSRAADGVDGFEDAIHKSGLDVEFIGLIHQIYRKGIDSCRYRSYVVLSPKGVTYKKSSVFFEEQKPLHIIFGKPTTNATYNDFFTLPQLSGTFKRINKILSEEGIDLSEMQPSPLKDLLVTISVQLSLIDLLNLLEVKPTKMSAISIGRLAKAYWERKVTLEEVVRCVCCLGNDSHGDSFKSYRSNGSKKNLFPPNVSDCFDDESAEVEVAEDDFVVAVGDCEAGGWVEVYDRKGRCYDTLRLLDCLGKIYENGFDLDLSKIYPKIDFPVSRGTQMLSHLFKWDHSTREYFVPFCRELKEEKKATTTLMVALDDFAYIKDNEYDGSIHIPIALYLNAVFELVTTNSVVGSSMKMSFENLEFRRVLPIQLGEIIEVDITVLRGSRRFEVSEKQQVILFGNYTISKETTEEPADIPFEIKEAKGSLQLNVHDIYKELRLRGYNFRSQFRNIKETNFSATEATIKFDKNFVTFLESFFHLLLLHPERNLYQVKTIGKLTIDSEKFTQTPEDHRVKYYETAKILRCDGIEITDVTFANLPEKKLKDRPIIEKYIFVPNEATLTYEASCRTNVQVTLENALVTTVKVVEYVNSCRKLLVDDILLALQENPSFTILPEYIIVGQATCDVAGVVVSERVTPTGDAFLVITENALSSESNLDAILKLVKSDGFFITREKSTYEPTITRNDLKILTVHNIINASNIIIEKLILVRRQQTSQTQKPKTLKITNNNYENWLKPLKRSVALGEDLVIYAQGEDVSGILALFRCYRLEAEENKLQCFWLLDDNLPEFNIENEFYEKQMNKRMAINVYSGGEWGTMRFLLFPELLVRSSRCLLDNIPQRGLEWVKGRENRSTSDNVRVAYVGICSGDAVPCDVATKATLPESYVFDYSGRIGNKRVMGLTKAITIQTQLTPNDNFVYTVPDDWSLEDAATVPGAYLLAIYSIYLKITLAKNNSILITTSNQSIALAALNLCKKIDCEIYLNTPKPTWKWYKQQYPKIHIGDSTTIQPLLLKATSNKGVDYVITDELNFCCSCLKINGEILLLAGEEPKTGLGLEIFRRGRALHGVSINNLLEADFHVIKKLNAIFVEGLKDGSVKPLVRVVVDPRGLERVDRVQKVVVSVLGEGDEERKALEALPRFYCDSKKTYVVLGGLGGAGFEVADWLVRKGAKNIVLTSRKGIRSGYQSFRIRSWKSKGVNLLLAGPNIGTEEGCLSLINEAKALGPIDAIFNLAYAPPDTSDVIEAYNQMFLPKPIATAHLDKITRTACPELRHFVIFSSFSSGRGHFSYDNYSMANCIMERICEKRRAEGYPALAIQWGPIGEVGVMGEVTDAEFAGSCQLSIHSLLNRMDEFMAREEAAGDLGVVSCFVIAKKRLASQSADEILTTISAMLGIKDFKSVSPISTLAELGLDSITAVEITRQLEKSFDMPFEPEEIRSFTFVELQELKKQSDEARKKKIEAGGFAAV